MTRSGAHLPAEGTLPALTGATTWLNSEPLTPESLRGKVVMADFCTYTCINWLRSLAEVLGADRYASLARMFQVRHVYELKLGVVDAEAIKKVRDLAAWRGRKYVLARSEIEAFLQTLNEAYDAVVRVLEAATPRRASQHSTAPRQPRASLRQPEEPET